MLQPDRQTAFSALIAGALMLLIGWRAPMVDLSGSALQSASCDVFNWILRIGGAAMVIVAATIFANWRYAALLDAVCSAIIGLGLAIVAAIWLLGADILYGGITLIFGLMFLNSARNSWLASRPPASANAGVFPRDSASDDRE